MAESASHHAAPLSVKFLTPSRIRDVLQRDARLIIPVGTTEQHGPHLPLGCDTLIVERLADDLSAEFGVLRAPTVEYGVNTTTRTPYPGNASVRRKTLHRYMNDLIGSWEDGGIRQFVILTAHGYDPHQEALSTLRTRHATIRTVDIFAMPLGEDEPDLPIHGGEIDTSLLLYLAPDVVVMDAARDFVPSRRRLRAFLRRAAGVIPADSPGSLGVPSRASVEKGARLYHLIYDRIAKRVFRTADARAAGAA